MILTSTRSGPDSPEAKANRDAAIKNVQDTRCSLHRRKYAPQNGIAR